MLEGRADQLTKQQQQLAVLSIEGPRTGSFDVPDNAPPDQHRPAEHARLLSFQCTGSCGNGNGYTFGSQTVAGKILQDRERIRLSPCS
jgi:hypothetical protein